MRPRRTLAAVHLARERQQISQCCAQTVAYCGARPKVGIWGGLLTCTCLNCLRTKQAEADAREKSNWPKWTPGVQKLCLQRIKDARKFKR